MDLIVLIGSLFLETPKSSVRETWAFRLILILRNTLAWFRDGAGFVTGGEDGYVRVHHLDKDYFSAKRFE